MKKLQGLQVEYFEKKDGTYPAEEFILSQDNKMKAKLFRLLDLLEMQGNQLRGPHSKYLEDGIFELRAKHGNNISRIFYFFAAKQKIILTNGFVKKTPKTPQGEIAIARKYKAEYESRKEQS